MLEMAFFNADFKFVESSTPFSKQDRATFRILCVSSYEDSAFFFLDTLAAPDGSRKSVTFAQTVWICAWSKALYKNPTTISW